MVSNYPLTTTTVTLDPSLLHLHFDLRSVSNMNDERTFSSQRAVAETTVQYQRQTRHLFTERRDRHGSFPPHFMVGSPSRPDP